MWTDAERGRASAYGAPVAPPSFVIGCFSGIQFGWPGLGAFHSATQAKFHKPVYWGDKVDATCRYDGFTGPRPSNFAGQMVTDHFLNTYKNQNDETVAEINWQVVNFERASARGPGRHQDQRQGRDRSPAPVGSQTTSPRSSSAPSPRSRVARSRATGRTSRSATRSTGSPKGPIGLTDEVAFIAGGGTPIPRLKAHAAALVDYDAHPAWSFRDPVMGSSEPIYAVHYNKAAANAMGVAFQYDVGFQRQCWQIHLLTNWCGDDGWVREVTAEYRGFVYLSDVVELGGEVTGKRVTDDGEHVVDVVTYARNQRGANVMPGTGVIALPTRSEGSPVRSRSRA